MSTINLNDTTPAAPGGNSNITWQQSGNDVSAYVPTASGSILGTAVFSASGGSISNATYTGVISSVTRLGAGHFQVNFSSSQSNYAVALQATDNNAAQVYPYISGNSFSTIQTSAANFSIYTYYGPPTNNPADPAVCTVAIF